MSELDFKGALDDLDVASREAIKAGFSFWDDPLNVTIQTALRVADRLQSGEVSDEMYKKSEEHDILYHRVASHDDIFKAMAKQLIKEES